MEPPEAREEVERALSRVRDPELDMPITDLGFVREISLEPGGGVRVRILMPTYWCSPNFTYMILEAARRELLGLGWARRVEVLVEGHHDSHRINQCVNRGLSFRECYPEEATDSLEGLSRLFRERALRSRLYGVLMILSRRGVDPGSLEGLRLKDVSLRGDRLSIGGRQVALTPQEARHLRGYLEYLASTYGEEASLVPEALRPQEGASFQEWLARLRVASTNIALNAELCKLLLVKRLERISNNIS